MKRVSETKRKPLTEFGRLRIGLLPVWLFVLLLLLVVGGCTQTDVEENQIPPHALKDVDAGFNLNVLASRPPVTRSITFTADGTIESDTLTVGVNDSVRTKAAAPLTDVQESQIASLWVGQYDAATGKRLFNQYLSSLTGTTVNLKLKQSQDGAKSRVYFVSNGGDLGAIADETTLKKHTLAYASTDAGLPENGLCKMMGTWEGEVAAGGVKNITVKLTRLLARITFSYSTGSDFTFTPSSVVLKNAPSLSQVEAPAAQLTTGITYKTYTGTASSAGATVYWYLPENMAGTVSGADTVDSEKKKIGTGVTNATCIELNGSAVQGGVTYKDVTFRFYPGSDRNNYDIIRNAHYTMSVTLVGIDVSDERITVGEIPPIEVDPSEMPAKKGGEKDIQITARPGQEWIFDMPVWLSAVLNGKDIPSGATITYQGPANVVFKAVEANPKAEKRSVSFDIDVNGTDQNITITQSGSTLTKGSDVSLSALVDAEGSSTFTATEGLQWLAVLSGGDGWLDWSATNPGTSGSEAPAIAQVLQVKAGSSNPSAQPRTGTIIVKAGASVGDAAYTGLKQEIGVSQAGSTVTGSEINIVAEGGSNQTSPFTATAGLDWSLSVAGERWITLTGSTSGTPTTGSAQPVTFDVAVNPSSSARMNHITVCVGDVSSGPTDKISVVQAASTLTASIDPTSALATTANASGTYTMNGTKGLSYSFMAGFPEWLTVTDGTASTVGGTTTGSDQQLTYQTVSINPNASERKATVTVKAGSMTKDVEIKQSASTFSVADGTATIAATGGSTTGSVTATEGLFWTISPETHNGITVSPTTGSGTQQLTFTGVANTGSDRTGSFTVTVTGASPARTAAVTATQATGETGAYVENLQVCKTDEAYSNWSTANTNCNNSTKEGKSDWRLPSKDELVTMYNNKAALEGVSGFTAFESGWYWCSAVYSSGHSVVNFSDGTIYWNHDYSNGYVRCVRDKN